MNYSEGIYTGYRWYDKMEVEPQYDFGYGLSYTTFAYGNMTVVEKAEEGEKVGYDVSFTVTNTGDVTGSEVTGLLGRGPGAGGGSDSQISAGWL